MTTPTSSQPTLWRTCRVLANRTRLRMLQFLFQEQPQTVSAVARRFDLPGPLTSQYLRALESRGFLNVRRAGRRVEYRIANAAPGEIAATLTPALRSTFHGESQSVEFIFRMATAFTHPRRIEIFRQLRKQPQTLGQLRVATGISTHPLLRHLRKLEARTFVSEDQGIYSIPSRTNVLGRGLARLAAGD